MSSLINFLSCQDDVAASRLWTFVKLSKVRGEIAIDNVVFKAVVLIACDIV